MRFQDLYIGGNCLSRRVATYYYLYFDFCNFNLVLKFGYRGGTLKNILSYRIELWLRKNTWLKFDMTTLQIHEDTTFLYV